MYPKWQKRNTLGHAWTCGPSLPWDNLKVNALASGCWSTASSEAFVSLVPDPLSWLATCWAPGDHHMHQDRAGPWFLSTDLESIPVGSVQSQPRLWPLRVGQAGAMLWLTYWCQTYVCFCVWGGEFCTALMKMVPIKTFLLDCHHIGVLNPMEWQMTLLRSSREGNGNILQYCLGNPMDRGA